MPTLSLPDGAARSFDAPVTGADFAAAVGPGLAKAALLVEVDGALRDLSRPIEQDASVRVITARDPAALEVIRHDTAHLLAEAVKELYPDVLVTIGPAIEDGFYYDFARDEPFTPADLEVIEARMAEIRERDEAVVREEWARDEAVRIMFWFIQIPSLLQTGQTRHVWREIPPSRGLQPLVSWRRPSPSSDASSSNSIGRQPKRRCSGAGPPTPCR